MGARYLCSRTEFLRMIDLDIGRRPIFIGVPGPFLDWLNKLLPLNSVRTMSIREIQGDSLFDRIILWTDNLPEIDSEDVDIISGCMKDGASIWTIHPVFEERNNGSKWMKTIGESLPVSTDHSLQRVELIG
jgi:hypothetical protein